MVALKNAMEDEDGQEVLADERSGRASPKPRSLPVSQEDNTVQLKKLLNNQRERYEYESTRLLTKIKVFDEA